MSAPEIPARPQMPLVRENDRVAISSRVRLARNLEGYSFPPHSSPAECEEVWRRLSKILTELPALEDARAYRNEDVSSLDRLLLVERHLVSREHAQKERGSGFVLSRDESICVMVNEEDHLRMQVLEPGLRLKEAWTRLGQVDYELEQRILCAFSGRFGYLTACPTNVGTGLRASVMVHLAALTLLDEIKPVIQGIEKIGVAVRGLWGEGTDAAGNMFQISNQMTLGENEDTLIGDITQFVAEIIAHEYDARERLCQTDETLLMDHVGRAWGVCAHAHRMSSREALNHLSALRLGVDMGMLSCIDRTLLDDLLVWVQPGHMQVDHKKDFDAESRDRERAARLRALFASGAPPSKRRRRKPPE